MIEEKDLIRRAGQGDSDAFRQLVETYQAPVYRLALRMCGGDAALAEDAAQEAFLAAWRGLPRFRGDSRIFSSINNVIDRFKFEGFLAGGTCTRLLHNFGKMDFIHRVRRIHGNIRSLLYETIR